MIFVKPYGNYKSLHGGPAMEVHVGVVTLYFSYQTIVAYRAPGHGLVVSENVWTVTTGKHLNWVNSDKKSRVPNDVFEQKFKEMSELYLPYAGGYPDFESLIGNAKRMVTHAKSYCGEPREVSPGVEPMLDETLKSLDGIILATKMTREVAA